jgi:alkylated DNA repair dioxygenase AlkB
MQTELFQAPKNFPPGFTYQDEFISKPEEESLLSEIKKLDLHPVVIRNVPSKRRVRHFGYGYSFEERRLTDPVPIPEFILPLRSRVAQLIKAIEDDLSEVLITEYPVSAVIGWHKDAAPFDVVVGISLLNPCIMKLRKGAPGSRKIIALDLIPRSVYVLDGEARADWEHHIPPAKKLRYSITFRTLKTK